MTTRPDYTQYDALIKTLMREHCGDHAILSIANPTVRSFNIYVLSEDDLLSCGVNIAYTDFDLPEKELLNRINHYVHQFGELIKEAEKATHLKISNFMSIPPSLHAALSGDAEVIREETRD